MPDILIAGWAVVLACGDALTTNCFLHRLRQQACRTEEVTAEIVGNAEDVFRSAWIEMVELVGRQDHAGWIAFARSEGSDRGTA